MGGRSMIVLEVAALSRPRTPMRTLNYIFSVTSIVLGVALILFMLIQSTHFNIGVAIGIVLVLNGAVRLWFAQDDH
jgi:hypothetical protein